MISLSPLSLPLKTISPSRLVATLLISISTSCLQAQESEESTYDKIWDKVVLYENEENSLISKFWLTGRLQGEYHSFENDISELITMIMIGEDFGLVSKQPYLVTLPYTRRRILA